MEHQGKNLYETARDKADDEAMEAIGGTGDTLTGSGNGPESLIIAVPYKGMNVSFCAE